ncbi:hypothetical protein GCM10023116_33540 [Kistimonas scapharcae]|uniref:Ankyrin n=1 Tax=Kistimonas scapharcae TaxID=1036133 RepID=A0ABP8V5A1_9GAMM
MIDAIVHYHDLVSPTDAPALKQFKKNIIPFLEKAMPDLARFSETYPEKAKELINHADADGDTALNCAASVGLTDLFNPLIHAGADINLEGSSTSFHHALIITDEKCGVSNYEILKLLIEALKSSGKFTQEELRDQINKKSNRLKSGQWIQQTALHKALSQPYKHHWKIVALLLEHGADPNVTNQDNQTALGLAIYLPFPESRDILTMIAAKTSIPNISECITQTGNAELKQLLEEQLSIRRHQQFLASTEQPPAPIVFTETEDAEAMLDFDFILSASRSTFGTAHPFNADIDYLIEPEHAQITESPEGDAHITPEISLPPVQTAVPSPATEMKKEMVSYSEQLETGDDPHATAETSMWVPSVERTQVPASPESPTPIDTTTKHTPPSGSETVPRAKTGFDSLQYQQTERRSTRLVALQTKEPETSQPAIQKGRKRKASTETPASKTKKIAG